MEQYLLLPMRLMDMSCDILSLITVSSEICVIYDRMLFNVISVSGSCMYKMLAGLEKISCKVLSDR